MKVINAFTSFFMQQVVGVVDITTLNNRQYCVILDPVDKDGKPQLGQKRLVKVQYGLLFKVEEPRPFSKHIPGCRSSQQLPCSCCKEVEIRRESRAGAVVRVLASHQCGPGSNPGPCVISGLSLLLVLVLALRVFLQIIWFSSLLKNQHF